MIKEIERKGLPGMLMVGVLVATLGLSALLMAWAAPAGFAPGIIGAALLFLTGAVSLGGFLLVNPNEARVLILFGKYAGSITRDGFWWVNPFTVKKRISRRVRN